MIHIPNANGISLGSGTLYVTTADRPDESVTLQVNGGYVDHSYIDGFDVEWAPYNEVVADRYFVDERITHLEERLRQIEKAIQDMGIDIELADIEDLL